MKNDLTKIEWVLSVDDPARLYEPLIVSQSSPARLILALLSKNTIFIYVIEPLEGTIEKKSKYSFPTGETMEFG